MVTFFSQKNAAIAHDFQWRTIHWHLVAPIVSLNSIEQWWVVKSPWFFIVHTAFKKLHVFFSNLGMSSQGINGWHPQNFVEKLMTSTRNTRSWRLFLSIHEPKLWLWLATSVTTRMCSRKTRRCVKLFLLRSVVIHHAGHLHSPKNMSNPESMSALTWKPSKSLARPLCWFPRKSDRMTTVQGRWYMLIGWRQWVA